MTEKSYFWTTGGAGDGSSTYSRSDWAKFSKIIAACLGSEGIAPNTLNSLVGSVPGANTARIASGMALVDGKAYDNDANVDVTIPSAVGGGNTRIDRIVLRANWTAQTVRITRIAGTDAASPTAPAITQVSGTTYDIKLYQALVNTSGIVTLTDERQMTQIQAAGITDANVTAAKLAVDSVETAKIKDANVTLAKMASNSVDAAKLVSNAVETAKIKDANVTAAKLATDSVETAKIKDGNVTTAKIANDAIDDTKVGLRVPKLTNRQGGSTTNWNNTGSTNYTPGNMLFQAGSILSSNSGAVAVTFPVPFAYNPLVFLQVADSGTSQIYHEILETSVSPTGFSISVYLSGSRASTPVYWLAIGPE